MRRRMRYRVVLALINIAAFAVFGIREHTASTSTPTRRSSPVENFACVPLERTALTDAEREWYSYIAGECRPPVAERLLIFANVGAFLLTAGLIRTVGRLGAANQVSVFYASMPIAIFLWWYILAMFVRLIISRRRSRRLTG